jgi:hypothetical protein
MISLDTINSAFHSIEVKTAAGQALAINGSGYLTISNSSFAVTATNLDIRALAYASDSVTAYQGETFTVSGSVTTNSGGYADWKVSKEPITTSESELVSTPLTGRLMINIQNLGTKSVFLAPATGVDVDDFELPARSSVEWQLDDTANIFAITATGTSDLRVAEFKA